MIFVILGPSGCGKGTQADLISKKYNLAHISTGDLLRREYEAGSELGIKAHEYWGKGNWSPTQLVEPILEKELSKYPKGGFILEGWPRLSEQKEILEKFLEREGQRLTRVFYLDTPREIAFERIKGRVERAIKAGQKVRADDTTDIINERLDVYFNTVGPILDYYRVKGLLEVIDNRPPIDVVFNNIERLIDGYNKN